MASRGIVASDGADPLRRWQSRITFLDSPPLSEAVRALLAGEPVDTQAGGLEVNWRHADPDRVVLTLRRRDAPYVVDIELAPVAPDLIDPGDDPVEASPLPSPDAWQRDVRPGVIRWRLFNALIHTIVPRPNA